VPREEQMKIMTRNKDSTREVLMKDAHARERCQWHDWTRHDSINDCRRRREHEWHVSWM
jgi:hypothetical protein